MALLLRVRDAPLNLEETDKHVFLHDVPDRILHCRHRARGRCVPALRASDVDRRGGYRAHRYRHSDRDQPHKTTRSASHAAVRRWSARLLAGTPETAGLPLASPKYL